MPTATEIGRNWVKMNNKTFSSSIKKTANEYKTGALIGAVMGIGCSIFVLDSKKLILCTIIGALGGGYIASKAASEVESDFKLKKVKTKKTE